MCVHRGWEVAGFSKRRPEPPARAGPGTQCSSQGLLWTSVCTPSPAGRARPRCQSEGRLGRRAEREAGHWLRAGQGHGKDQSWRQGGKGDRVGGEGKAMQTGAWVGPGGSEERGTSWSFSPVLEKSNSDRRSLLSQGLSDLQGGGLGLWDNKIRGRGRALGHLFLGH